MSNVNALRNAGNESRSKQLESDNTDTKKKGFGRVMSKLADGALETVSAVGSVVPGGSAVSAAARGLKAMKDGAQSLDTREQLDKMWDMQRENQMYNLEYLEMQTAVQAENRRYTTVSNLMKARHDTAKAAINNMKV